MNVTADYFEVCEKYDEVNCTEIKTKWVGDSLRNIRLLIKMDFLIKSYQPLNGICANPEHPYKGAINTPYARIIPNSFDDCKAIKSFCLFYHWNFLFSDSRSAIVSSRFRPAKRTTYFDRFKNAFCPCRVRITWKPVKRFYFVYFIASYLRYRKNIEGSDLGGKLWLRVLWMWWQNRDSSEIFQ